MGWEAAVEAYRRTAEVLTAWARLRARWLVAFVGIALVTLGLFGAEPASAASQSITSAGPLTNITISDQLNCSVNHTGDASGEWFNDTACGTFVVTGGMIFGPASIPAGSRVVGATGYHAWTPVSQSAVTGSGTSSDPYKIVTVVSGGTDAPIQVTQTDSYVVGQEAYRTDVVVTNTGGAASTPRLYLAGDCYLQDSDNGFGRVDNTTHAVTCVGEAKDAGGNVTGPGTRIEQLFPLSGGSHYMEDVYSTVWERIGSQQPFPDTCKCDSDPTVGDIDNGEGLSWDLSLAPGASDTRSNLTSFSPAGNQPLITSKSADAPSVSGGSPDGYTITIHNPNTSAATVDSVTDTLPSGFTYRSGTTTGATTTDPSVSGQNLSWAGPFTIPAGGDLTLHFGVTASNTPGDYFNNAGGTSSSSAIVPTGNTAKITVTGAGTTTTTSTTSSTSSTTSTTTPGGGGTTTTTSTTVPGGGGGSTTTTTSTTTSSTSTSTTSSTTSSTSTTSSSTSSSTTSTTVAGGGTTSTTSPRPGGGGGTTTTTPSGGGSGGTTSTTTNPSSGGGGGGSGSGGGGGGSSTTSTTTSGGSGSGGGSGGAGGAGGTTTTINPGSGGSGSAGGSGGSGGATGSGGASPANLCSQTQSVSTVSPSRAAAGGTVTVTDTCFAPGATLSAQLQSTPVSLGTVTADASGRYTLTFVVPKAMQYGTHHVVVTGASPNGATHVSTGTLSVVGSRVEGATLPRTGPPRAFTLLLILAGLALSAGSVLSAAPRRRPRPASDGFKPWEPFI